MDPEASTAVDVVGDVHGHADALEALLASLGYEDRNGAWRHPSRTAMFLGDLVDRGPEQLRTVSIVRRMMDAGSARCVMGNHELNAIAFATEDGEGSHLRPRDARNRHQHDAFLSAVGEDGDLHRELVRFFLELPLHAGIGPAVAVHACWHPASADLLKASGSVLADGRLDPSRLDETLGDRRARPLFEAVEILLKGPEVDLPRGRSFVDAYGIRRRRTRLLWWNEGSTYGELCPPADASAAGCADDRVPVALLDGVSDPSPVFFGHYWMRGEPALMAPDRACLDFSVARDGVLCAYRYDGETVLDPENLVWTAPGAEPAFGGPLP